MAKRERGKERESALWRERELPRSARCSSLMKEVPGAGPFHLAYSGHLCA
jgi:hypothetical protein